MLSADEIRSRTFLVGLRGFDREEVKTFLGQVADLVERLQERVHELETDAPPAGEGGDRETAAAAAPAVRAGELVPDEASPFAEVAQETQRILEAAQAAAEDIRVRAREDADREMKSARSQAARVIAEGERRREEIERVVDALVGARSGLSDDLRAVANTIERLLRDLAPEPAAATVRQALAAAARHDSAAKPGEPAPGQGDRGGVAPAPDAAGGGAAARETVEVEAAPADAGSGTRVPGDLGAAEGQPHGADGAAAVPERVRAPGLEGEGAGGHGAAGGEERGETSAEAGPATGPIVVPDDGAGVDPAHAVDAPDTSGDPGAEEEPEQTPATGGEAGAGDGPGRDADDRDEGPAERPDAAGGTAPGTGEAGGGPVDGWGPAVGGVEAEPGTAEVAGATGIAAGAAAAGAAAAGAAAGAAAAASAAAAGEGAAGAAGEGAPPQEPVSRSAAERGTWITLDEEPEGGDESAVLQERRMRALAPLHPRLVRRLKRGLQELQDATLDGLQRDADRDDVEPFLPDSAAVRSLSALAEEQLRLANAAGIAAGKAATGVTADIEPSGRALADQLGSELGGVLVTRLADTLRKGFDASEEMPTLGERVDAVFARVRNGPASDVAAVALVRAYEGGQKDAWRHAGITHRRWVRATEPPCTDSRCADNEAAGPVPLGERFPSRHDAPPVRPGCNCSTAPSAE